MSRKKTASSKGVQVPSEILKTLVAPLVIEVVTYPSPRGLSRLIGTVPDSEGRPSRVYASMSPDEILITRSGRSPLRVRLASVVEAMLKAEEGT